MEESQKINPLILHRLQAVEEETEKGLGGITLHTAGSNHSMPLETVTDEDFWVLSRINPYINGLDVSFHLVRDVGAYDAAKLCQKQYNLIYLTFMFNNIGPKEELIAKALPKTKTLKCLKIMDTRLKIKVESSLLHCYKLIHP